ncbi:MAG: hypothetical protein ACMUHU_07410 [Thermoplasmatota archaeon]
MPDEDGKTDDGIEVRISPDADKKTRERASMLAELFKGPLFAKLVREAVEDMILEGKLTYDLETDEFDLPEDIVKRWAVRMEEEVWSRKKGKRRR